MPAKSPCYDKLLIDIPSCRPVPWFSAGAVLQSFGLGAFPAPLYGRTALQLLDFYVVDCITFTRSARIVLSRRLALKWAPGRVVLCAVCPCSVEWQRLRRKESHSASTPPAEEEMCPQPHGRPPGEPLQHKDQVCENGESCAWSTPTHRRYGSLMMIRGTLSGR